MSRLLQLSTIGDEYRDAWESAVSEDPACGFMQSLTWAELQARQGVEVYPRLWLRDGRVEGGAIFHAARSLDGPGILVTPGGPLVPWRDPGRAALLFAAIRREACRLRRATGSILWRIEPRLAAPLPPYMRGFVRAPVDLDPFETNEVDLSGGMAGVLARMTSKGRYNVGLARRHGVEVEATTDPASAARFHPLLAETAARQGFAAEPLCYLMDLAATLFPARMAAAYFATYRGETLAAAIVVFFGPRATYLYGASRREHREVMAPSALQAAVMASAIDRGCATYDLYGIDAQGDRADHAYRRLSQFKRHFGGANRVYAGAQDLYSYDRIADAMLPFLQHLAVEEVPASRPAPGSCTRAPSPPARETPGTFPDRKRKGVNQP
jgi:peptidoglycan pentaglycine glycine transferase (the first glycine)